MKKHYLLLIALLILAMMLCFGGCTAPEETTPLQGTEEASDLPSSGLEELSEPGYIELEEAPEPPQPQRDRITIISNGVEYQPYEAFLHAGGRSPDGSVFSATGAFTDLSERFETLPEIPLSDDFEIVFEVVENEQRRATLHNVVLFNDKLESVFIVDSLEDIPFPDEPGLYLLMISAVFSDLPSESWSALGYIFKISI